MTTIEAYHHRQIDWSRQTFGPGKRTKGICDHIRKEADEAEAKPHDLSEWVDLMILAMDGFWRHGGEPEDLMPMLLAKQKKNMARTWPDWRTMSEDKAIEHDRSKEPPMTADRAALVERVARAMADRAGASYSWEWYRNQGIATAAIDLIRAEVLEEAARVAENTPHWTDVGKPLGKMPTSRDDIATAIRALKEAPCSFS